MTKWRVPLRDRGLLLAVLVVALGGAVSELLYFGARARRPLHTDGNVAIPEDRLEERRIVRWERPEALFDGGATRDRESGPTVSPAGDRVCYVVGDPGGNTELWLAERSSSSGTGWTRRRLEELSSAADERGPWLDRDGSTLYFASDRAGGHGGFDLYVAVRDGDRFLRPVNLGPEVNSAGDELDPTLDEEGRWLVFASDREAPGRRPPSLYGSVRQGATWGSPTRLDALSSPFRDLAPELGPEGRTLYFASDRPGGAGGLDLYRSIRFDHRWLPPEALSALNTEADESDPALSGEGFSLLFVRGGELLLTRTRELFRWETRGDRVLSGFGSLVLCLLVLLLTVYLARRWAEMGILGRSVLASLIVHALLFLYFNEVMVRGSVLELPKRGERYRIAFRAPHPEMPPGERPFEKVRGDRVAAPPAAAAPAARRAPVAAPDPVVDARPPLRGEAPTIAPAVEAAGSEVTRSTPAASIDIVLRPQPPRRPARTGVLAAARTPAATSVRETSDGVRPRSRPDSAPPERGPDSRSHPRRVERVPVDAPAAAPSAPGTPALARAVTPVLRPRAVARPEPGTPPERSPLPPSSHRTPAGETPVPVAASLPAPARPDALAPRPGSLPGPSGKDRLARAEGPAPKVADPSPPASRLTFDPIEPPCGSPRVDGPAAIAGAGPRRPVPEPPATGPARTVVAIAPVPLVDRASGPDPEPPSPEPRDLLVRAVPEPAAPSAVAPPVVAAMRREPSLYDHRTGEAKLRALREYGGSDASEEAVRRGLEYLARVQRADGSWGAPRYRHHKYGQVQIGKTGLALLAFLGSGHTHRSGTRFSGNAARAIRFLLEAQDRRTGHFGAGSAYSHGIATYALAEAHAMTRDPELRSPLSQAVGRILAAQVADEEDRLRHGGWSYFYADDRIWDTWPRASVTAWQVMALKSAEMGGIRVPPEALAAARMYLRRSFDRAEGYFRYCHDPERLRSAYRTLPGSTPAAMFALLLLGEPPGSERIRRGTEFVMARIPRRYARAADDRFVLEAAGNLYFAYYATLALFTLGGEPWQDWNRRQRDLLVDAQNKDGSWTPISPYAEYANDTASDRSYTTALCVLVLEVYYRYVTPLLTYRPERTVPDAADEAGPAGPVRVRVVALRANSAAHRGGVRVGDELLRYAGDPVTGTDRLQALIEGHAGRPRVALEVGRHGRVVRLFVPGGPLGITVEER